MFLIFQKLQAFSSRTKMEENFANYFSNLKQSKCSKVIMYCATKKYIKKLRGKIKDLGDATLQIRPSLENVCKFL